MNRNNSQNPPQPLDGMSEEARIRRALGLGSSSGQTHQQRPEQARQRHRFVADGDVPVVMLNRTDTEAGGLKEKLAAADAALEQERAAHALTRRALQEATASLQALRTRLGHAELAHAEALATERHARQEAEDALAALRAAPPAPAPALAPAIAAVATPVPVTAQPSDPDADVALAPGPERAARKRAVRKDIPGVPTRAAREEKPVRWWTPSYRAKRS